MLHRKTNLIDSKLFNFTYNCNISPTRLYKINPLYLGTPYIPIPLLCFSNNGSQVLRYTRNRISLSIESKNKSDYCSNGFDKIPLSFLTSKNKSSYCNFSLLPNDNTSKLLFKYNIEEINSKVHRLEFTTNNADISNDLRTFLKTLHIKLIDDSTMNLCKISFPDPIFKDKLVEVSRNF